VKRNFQIMTDEITGATGGRKPRLLLHCCCGPCGTYVLEYLCEFFEVTALFYNPNIYPEREYEKRLYWLENVVNRYGGTVKTAVCEYDGAAFDEISEGLEIEPEGGARCTECFRLRLRQSARMAKEGGFDLFCTTLTVSPHKDAERINDIGFELEREFGVKWLPSDFKKREGYKRSIERSREYGLYRQEYCGCSFSLEKNEEREKDEQHKQQDL
jgi:predicted adenine nucleotide alpha hydrolase (AANH) superfamily ATPase